MAQEVFRRYEKKYMITIEQYNDLMSQMITKMSADQYGKHTISNIYFDTPGFDLIRTSLSKPVYKEKIRLRSYGTPGEEDTVFIELKKKFDGVVYKRRIPMPLKDARKYLYYGIIPEGSSQILQEIDYAMNLYKPKPKVYLAYERIAFYGKEDPELRVTFDMNIRARENNLDLSKGTYGIPLLEKGKLLMEIKIPGVMPVWMSRLLSELEIFPVSYSKYGTYYKEYIAAQEIYEGGKICA
ncbi:MAG: polyphosphate polymerase domain-containing protein [Lachnospiraceae bacterium]